MADLFNIQGKILGIVLANAPPESTGLMVLEDTRLETQAGREFVTGTIPDVASETWVHGLRSAVAWDAIGYYVVFDSKDEYRKRVAMTKRRFWRRIFGR
jgi:hypothetical protein